MEVKDLDLQEGAEETTENAIFFGMNF